MVLVGATAAIAQLVRVLARKAKVPGSSPANVSEWLRRQAVQSLWGNPSPPEQSPGNQVNNCREDSLSQANEQRQTTENDVIRRRSPHGHRDDAEDHGQRHP